MRERVRHLDAGPRPRDRRRARRAVAAIGPRAADDEQAAIAPFVDPRVAEWINGQIESGLREPGAIDLTAAHRNGPRLVRWEGSTYLLPTIIYCDSPSHPLANREFLFRLPRWSR